MPGKTPSRIQYTVACGCGAPLTLDSRAFGRALKCASCRGTVVVAWGRDPKSQKAIPVAVNPGGRPKTRVRRKQNTPLIPLAPTRPLRVKVKVGDRYFECSCGERILLRDENINRPLQCPWCERVHIVETDIPPPPAPKEEPKPKLSLGEFLCRCGEVQPPRTSKTGRLFTCRKCGRQGYVEASGDRRAVTPVFTSEPASAAKAPGPASPAKERSHLWTCVCGRAIEAFDVLTHADTVCAGCGRSIRMEKTRLPEPGKTLIRPVFGDLPAQVQEPVVASDAQVLPCGCGAGLLIPRNLVGQMVRCPACSDILAVEAGGLRKVGKAVKAD